ncbi:hypothetical protein LMG9449_1604 [Lactococcus lactis subsp. lactis]|nr:hypothetical protein LMG9449_1604 [Lactococcus lactis subsp. lactis]
MIEEAPSFIGQEFPAVAVPLVVKAGVNLLKASIEDLGRTV